MKQSRLKFCLPVLALVLVGMQGVSGAESAAARVNGHVIGEAEVQAKMRPVVNRMRLKPGSAKHRQLLPLIRKKALEILTEQAVVLTSSKAGKLAVSSEELSKEVTRLVAAKAGGDLEKFKMDLARRGQSFALWKKELGNSMVIARIKDDLAGECKPCTPEEAAALYKEEKQRFLSGGRVKVSLIRLDPAHVREPNLRLFSTAVRDSVQEGENGRWDELAREYSSGPKAGTGGHWDWTALSDLPDNLGEAVDGLDPGGVVRVTRGNCFYVVRLDAVEEKVQMSFAEAREKVAAEVMRRKAAAAWLSWLKAEKKKARIQIRKNQ